MPLLDAGFLRHDGIMPAVAIFNKLLNCENDARRASGFHDLAGRRELAGFAIDLKGDDGVTVFVRRVELASGRIESEEARLPALNRFPTDMGQHPARVVDAKYDDAVVSTVRCVYEISRSRDGDFRTRIVAGVGGRRRGNYLERLELAAIGIPVIRGDG